MDIETGVFIDFRNSSIAVLHYHNSAIREEKNSRTFLYPRFILSPVVKGILVGGNFSELIVRQKHDERFQIGELLVGEGKHKFLLQVYDLHYGSQVSSQHLELMGGLQLEQQPLVFFDAGMRNYTIAHLKSLVSIDEQGRIGNAKALPEFFTHVRELRADDFSFLQKPEHPLFLGKLRSGSQVLDFPLFINGKDAFSHHVLIAATTGRGKSNLLKCLLWELVDEKYCGILVLDPHDEYYRNTLDRHPSRQRIHQYSVNPEPGGQTLRFNLCALRPHHFNGSLDWTDAQREALMGYYKEYRDQWIEAIAFDKPLSHRFHEGTLAVVRRRVMQTLNIDVQENIMHCEGLFTATGSMTTVSDICNRLEQGDLVIIDTSSVEGAVEILVGSIIAHELLIRYKRYKLQGTLSAKPVISIILEEAPRVIGKEVLEQGPNVFSTIAREGRKFQIGLTAITQLPSLIPREILANMNTKIILGLEMKAERQAMIESACQDLSTDDRAIASLDRGEAIVTSTFVPFALPIRIPRFEEHAKPAKPKAFSGVKLG